MHGLSRSMNRLLNINELSASLNIKPSTLYAWAARGKLPCRKIHGLLRFPCEEIDRWLEGFRPEKKKQLCRAGKRNGTGDLNALIARAKREVYTPRRGETRPRSSLIRKEERDGAV